MDLEAREVLDLNVSSEGQSCWLKGFCLTRECVFLRRGGTGNPHVESTRHFVTLPFFFIGYVEDNNNDMYLVHSCCESRTKQPNYPLYMV